MSAVRLRGAATLSGTIDALLMLDRRALEITIERLIDHLDQLDGDPDDEDDGCGEDDGCSEDDRTF